MADPLAGASVRRVAQALNAAGSAARIVLLAETARTAEDAARSLGCELGAIVKTLVFEAPFADGGRLVAALVAGDRRCDAAALGRALGAAGPAKRADADRVRAETGFAIGGVAPVGATAPLPTAIDASLARFAAVHAAAGHPHCVFATTVDELVHLTGGRLVDDLGIAL